MYWRWVRIDTYNRRISSLWHIPSVQPIASSSILPFSPKIETTNWHLNAGGNYIKKLKSRACSQRTCHVSWALIFAHLASSNFNHLFPRSSQNKKHIVREVLDQLNMEDISIQNPYWIITIIYYSSTNHFTGSEKISNSPNSPPCTPKERLS